MAARRRAVVPGERPDPPSPAARSLLLLAHAHATIADILVAYAAAGEPLPWSLEAVTARFPEHAFGAAFRQTVLARVAPGYTADTATTDDQRDAAFAFDEAMWGAVDAWLERGLDGLERPPLPIDPHEEWLPGPDEMRE